MTSAQEELKLLLAYQRVAAFLRNLAEERSELGASARQLLPDLDLMRSKLGTRH